ncbi:MAG TPA: lysine--tRNA ligase [Candidatus Paceibacterota bacterium]
MIEVLREERLRKLKNIKDRGINPYPASAKRSRVISDALKSFSSLSAKKTKIYLVGRIRSIRDQGGILFMDLQDDTASIQLVVKKEDIGDDFIFWRDNLDIGDFLQVRGYLLETKRGEKSLGVLSITILSKSLLPIPSDFYGIHDEETRLRKRYLDILVNKDAKEIFIQRAKFWEVTRKFLRSQNFLEVETPILEVTTGGAEATPFKTHHNDYDMDVYLRVSVGELWQKRLMAAGFGKTFEIGRIFRNEGSSPEHLQEFTNLEFYLAYADFEDGIAFTEKMIKEVVEETFGKTAFSTRGFSFDLSGNWPRIDYVETVEKMTGINVLKATENEMMNKLKDLGVSFEGSNRERLTDTLWKYCRKQIAGPTWLINHPKLVSPLAKVNQDNPDLTLRVQLILAGAEVTNGFAELNDPIDQCERFDLQKKLIEKGDVEAMMPDDEFVEMLEHGMPPTFGFAYGERLFAFLVDKPLRETQLFPLMKPRKNT